MARPNEHNIERNLWNTPISENNSLYEGLLSSYNWNRLFDTFNNNTLEYNHTFIRYNNTMHDIKNLLNDFKNKFNSNSDFLKKDNIQINCHEPLDNENLQKIFEKLRHAIDSASKITLQSCTEITEITTQDFFHFIKYLCKINLTNEDIIQAELGAEVVKQVEIFTFKDNLSTRCSDDIILFNIAVILIIERDRKTLPFSILNERTDNEIWIGYEPNFSKAYNFNIIYENLKKIKLNHLPLSDECIYGLIFFTFLSETYKNLNSQLTNCITYYSSLCYIFQAKSQTLLSKYRISPTTIELYNTLLIPFINSPLYNEDATLDLKNAKKQITEQKRNLTKKKKQLKNLFTELISEYKNILPNILQEIIHDEECAEILAYNNEILEEANELISMLENNNLSRFNKLLDFYNQPGITDKIILILFNWIALDDNISNNFVSIFKNKMNYTIVNFPPDNSTEMDKTLLINFLEKRCLSYHYTEMLTFIDYNSLTLEEWNFLINLPNSINTESDFISCFYDFIISYRGTNAFTCIDDIHQYLTSFES